MKPLICKGIYNREKYLISLSCIREEEKKGLFGSRKESYIIPVTLEPDELFKFLEEKKQEGYHVKLELEIK